METLSTPPSIFLTDLDENLLSIVLGTYLDFKSLVNFTLVISGSPHAKNRQWRKQFANASHQASSLSYPPLFTFSRLTLPEITIEAEGGVVTQPSLALIRSHYHVKGLRFDLRLNRKTKKSMMRWGTTAEKNAYSRNVRLSSIEELNNTEISRQAIIRRIPFLVAAFDEVETLSFELEGDDVDVSHLSSTFKNLASVLQAGFCRKVEIIKVPSLKRMLGVRVGNGMTTINPNILRLLIDSAADDVFPDGYHPLSFDTFIGVASINQVAPRTDQERILQGAIELLYYHLPNAKSRKVFAKQLLVGA